MSEESPAAVVDQELALARRAAPTWNLARQQQTIWGVKGRLQARRRRSSSLFAAVALAATLCIGWVSWRTLAAPSPKLGATAIGAERWDLRDGSRILIEDPATVIKKRLESESEIAFELDTGAAAFQVVRKPNRVFRVHAGAVTVEVLGTSFKVTRHQARSEVKVQSGQVVVSWPGGSRTLAKGDIGLFPPESTAAFDAQPSDPEPSARSAAQEATASTRAQTASTRAQDEPTTSGALFASADSARKSGRPNQAVGYLRAITDRYPNDPRAPLAAFTRGRVLLESLGRPREAAAAFAQARSLSGQGTLAEDALAREVEAYRAAGDVALARERAELYRRAYPKGLRLHQVLRSGGLQDAP